MAGSVANVKGDGVYNTAYIFNREGSCIAEYDKTHLFTPMGEQDFFELGDHTVNFELDGVACAMVICYDIRFPELIRTLTLRGVDVLFVAAQWPRLRKGHWQVLNRVRAIENQCFVVAVNGGRNKIRRLFRCNRSMGRDDNGSRRERGNTGGRTGA